MANTNSPSGFRPVARVDGAAWSSKHTTCKMQNNAGALNRGDGVSQLLDGTVAVAAAAAGHVFRGIYEGCHYQSLTMGYPIWSNYWPGAGASGLVDVYVIDDPNVVFEGMASAGPITLADVGMNADVVVAASTTGFSKWSIGVPAVTATFPWKIFAVGNMGVYIQDGLDATAANNIVEVAPNEWFLTKGAGI
ncbi:MAG TPA: hypothetical protein VNS88_04580 [Nitrospiraceae bacterium]|nr:hypothetical protein [Nitrospiraceae bacterium]